jgi:2-haloacid dehalogenase
MEVRSNNELKVISFDCYGTLIDWRSGVLKAIRLIVEDYHVIPSDEELFSLFFRADQEMKQRPYQSYRKVLREQMRLMAKWLYLNLHPDDLDCLVRSLPSWEPFPDTIESLKTLQQWYRLAILSNIDDDLFSKTNEWLQVKFDRIITAQQLQSYKPKPAHFEKALETFGVKKTEILHVAQSIFHDIVPCHMLGIKNAWINRYADPLPDDPVCAPDLIFPDLATFTKHMLAVHEKNNS